MAKKRKCIVCGDWFTRQGNRKTCSDNCKDIRRRVTAPRRGAKIGSRIGIGGVSGSNNHQWKTAEQIFQSKQSRRHRLHRALQEVGVPYECSSCGQKPFWNGKPLTIEIDHIDGDRTNNSKENLRYLCPNCHSQCDETNRPYKNRK